MSPESSPVSLFLMRLLQVTGKYKADVSTSETPMRSEPTGPAQAEGESAFAERASVLAAAVRSSRRYRAKANRTRRCAAASGGVSGRKIETSRSDPSRRFRHPEWLAKRLVEDAGWKLQITKRGQRAFQVKGLTWILNGPSPGWGGIVASARITNTGCRHRKRCWIFVAPRTNTHYAQSGCVAKILR
jgi:hypothetical protein